MADSHLRGRLLRFKCEWLNLTLTRNWESVKFTIERTHTIISLRFWVYMWCQGLLDPWTSHWYFQHFATRTLQHFPPQTWSGFEWIPICTSFIFMSTHNPQRPVPLTFMVFLKFWGINRDNSSWFRKFLRTREEITWYVLFLLVHVDFNYQ